MRIQEVTLACQTLLLPGYQCPLLDSLCLSRDSILPPLLWKECGHAAQLEEVQTGWIQFCLICLVSKGTQLGLKPCLLRPENIHSEQGTGILWIWASPEQFKGNTHRKKLFPTDRQLCVTCNLTLPLLKEEKSSRVLRLILVTST